LDRTRISPSGSRSPSLGSHVSNVLYEEITERFDTKAVFDMISLAGIYMTVSALLNAFEVPAG
jgi:hypothetical protein